MSISCGNAAFHTAGTAVFHTLRQQCISLRERMRPTDGVGVAGVLRRAAWNSRPAARGSMNYTLRVYELPPGGGMKAGLRPA